MKIPSKKSIKFFHRAAELIAGGSQEFVCKALVRARASNEDSFFFAELMEKKKDFKMGYPFWYYYCEDYLSPDNCKNARLIALFLCIEVIKHGL